MKKLMFYTVSVLVFLGISNFMQAQVVFRGFTGTAVKWHDYFCINTETPVAGDFNGDKKDDIATFTGGSAADVFVAISNGTSFVGTAQKWHDSFCYGTEIPLAGDFNGDGKDDIVTFTRGNNANAFVAFSSYDNTFKGTGVKAHDSFCYRTEIPLAGRFNNGISRNIATFTRGTAGDVFVAISKVDVVK
jgi:hypothetical protein